MSNHEEMAAVRYRRLASILAGATGGALAIAAMELLSERAAFPLVFVPFATSIVLVMGSPETDAAQPRALVGGHLVATAVGLLMVKVVGPGPWVAATDKEFAPWAPPEDAPGAADYLASLLAARGFKTGTDN